jgi:hypothetical protein
LLPGTAAVAPPAIAHDQLERLPGVPMAAVNVNLLCIQYCATGTAMFVIMITITRSDRRRHLMP